MNSQTTSAPAYLADRHSITGHRTAETPRYGVRADGYSTRDGSPTCHLVKLDDRGPWRRVRVWQFSNAGTAFIRVGGECLILRDDEIPEQPI